MNPTTVREIFTLPLTSKADCLLWVNALAKINLLFHWDDSPEDIGNSPNGGEWVRCFSDAEVPFINERVGELFQYLDCPFEAAIEAMGEDCAP